MHSALNRSNRRSYLKWSAAALVMIACAAVAVWLFYRRDDRGRPLNIISTVAGIGRTFGEPFGVAVRGREIYVSDGEQGKIWVVRDGTVKVYAEGFATPSAIAFDTKGNLIVADSGAQVIRSVSPGGEVSIIAGVLNKRGFVDGDAAEALFNGPVGVAVAGDGRIFVADTYNDRIRVIENSRVRTLAGGQGGFADGANPQFNTPTGVAVRRDKLLVADLGNHRVRAVDPDGRAWTLAGDGRADIIDGPLLSAAFYQPTGVAVAPSGEIYITDGNSIRAIAGDPLPMVRTVSSKKRGLIDGRPALSRFNRPSCLASADNGDLLITDSDNRLVRVISSSETGHKITPDEVKGLFETADEFRALQPPRWPYDPPEAKREIAGTLGEIRGDMPPTKDPARFHNGLDIAGGYGETARFVRTEKVLRPVAAENFGTLREFIRMPTMGYIHIRLGRDQANTAFDDERFQIARDAAGKVTGIRVPRGAAFNAGEPIGTLNAMNHVHLIAGRSGWEINALDALVLPGHSDSRPPTIENVTLFDQNWQPLETGSLPQRIKLSGNTRIVVRGYDQVDGNSDRRRLGVYRVGYQLLHPDLIPAGDVRWPVVFDRMPSPDAVAFAYAGGSHSGATGETIFNYIATNSVDGESFAEGFFDAAAVEPGEYVLRVALADQSGNITNRDINVEVIR